MLHGPWAGRHVWQISNNHSQAAICRLLCSICWMRSRQHPHPTNPKPQPSPVCEVLRVSVGDTALVPHLLQGSGSATVLRLWWC